MKVRANRPTSTFVILGLDPRMTKVEVGETASIADAAALIADAGGTIFTFASPRMTKVEVVSDDDGVEGRVRQAHPTFVMPGLEPGIHAGTPRMRGDGSDRGI